MPHRAFFQIYRRPHHWQLEWHHPLAPYLIRKSNKQTRSFKELIKNTDEYNDHSDADEFTVKANCNFTNSPAGSNPHIVASGLYPINITPIRLAEDKEKIALLVQKTVINAKMSGTSDHTPKLKAVSI